MKTNPQCLLDTIIEQEFTEQTAYKECNDFFNFFAAKQMLKSYDLSDEEIEEGVVDGPNDGGVDAAYVFIDGEYIREDEICLDKYKREAKLEFCIIQAKNTYKFGESVVQKWVEICSKLLVHEPDDEDDIKRLYNARIIEIFERFKNVHKMLIRKSPEVSFRFMYVSKGSEIHPNVEMKGEFLKSIVSQLYPAAKMEIDFIGAQKLMDKFNESISESLLLRFLVTPVALEGNTSYVGAVKLSEYYSFLIKDNGDLQKHIFESNVRDYQGSTSVNKSIAHALHNSSQDVDFWWLNNGVTILASNITPQTQKDVIIEKPEIVNGLQTSTEIYNYFSSRSKEEREKDGRSILVRLIVPQNDETRDKIIVATNSQTTIPKSSLRATDNIHREIELYFKTRNLYYDRRKNYYKNEGKPASSIVSLSFLAQCLMSVVLQRPNDARARPSTLLDSEDTYAELYNERVPLDLYYQIAKFGKTVQTALKRASTYDRIVVSDIIFYVMYACIATDIGKAEFNVDNLKSVDFSKYNQEYILRVAKQIYNEYIELGGSDKVVKRTLFIEKLKKEVEDNNLV